MQMYAVVFIYHLDVYVLRYRNRRIHLVFLGGLVPLYKCVSVTDAWIYFPIHIFTGKIFGSHCHCHVPSTTHTMHIYTVLTESKIPSNEKRMVFYFIEYMYEADKMLIAHAHELRVDTLIAFSRHVVRMYNKMQCGFFSLLLLLFGCYGTQLGYRLLWKIICSIRVFFHSLSNSERFDRGFKWVSESEREPFPFSYASYGLRMLLYIRFCT